MIEDNSVSRIHLRLHVDGEAVRFEDLRSIHGVTLNGQRVASGEVRVGDQLQVTQTTMVRISEPSTRRKPSAPKFALEVTHRPPEWGMAEAARVSDAALQVYADWLGTQGDDASAEWARLIPSQDKAATRARMAVLAMGLGASFRSTLARGPVERCANKACSQRWESLSLEKEPWERACTACTRTVTWCEDSETARSVVGPVVLDPATPRTPGDLFPRPTMVD